MYPSAVANAWLSREYKSRGGKYGKVKKSEAVIDLPPGHTVADIERHDKGHDNWHAMHGDPPCKDEADCARMRASYKEENTVVKYSDSQERDEHGRFASGGGGESNSKGTVQNAIDKYSDKQDKADSTYSDARGYDTKHSYGKATDAHKEAAKAATEVANHPGASLGTKEYFARQAALHTAFAKAYAAAAKSTKE